MRVCRAMALLTAVAICASGQRITIGDVSRHREQAARAKGLTDAERTEISSLYEQAAQFLQQEVRWKAQQVGHARTKALVESELAAARSAASLPTASPPPAPPSETAQQVEDELTRVRNNRASRIKLRDDLSKLQPTLAERLDAIRTRRSDIQQELQSIADEVFVLALASALPQWQDARRAMLEARRLALRQELAALAVEREIVDLRQQLVPLQRDACLLRLAEDVRYLGELETRKNAARMRDAKKAMDDASSHAGELAKGFPHLAPFAVEITRRATLLWAANGIEAKSDKAAAQSRDISVSKQRLEQITANTLRRYQNSGPFSAATEWWPRKIDRFGQPSEVELLVATYSATETMARRDLFRLEEEADHAPAFETELQQLLDGSGKAASDADFADLKSRARSMLQLKRSVTAQLLTSQRLYVNVLGEAHRNAEELLTTLRELHSFVLSRVLWSRSVSGPLLPSPSECHRAFLWLFAPSGWARILAGFTSAGLSAAYWMAGMLAIAALYWMQGWLSGTLQARKLATRGGRFRHLCYGIFFAMLRALPGPLAIGWLGWGIVTFGEASELAKVIAAGAGMSAWLLFFLLLLRGLLASRATAEPARGWPQAPREVLNVAVRFAMVFTPLWFVSSALAADGINFNSDPLVQAHHNSLGRLCFLIAVLSVLVIGRGLLNPERAIANTFGPVYDGNRIARHARVAHWGLIIVASSAFLLALAGFYTTAYLLVLDTFKTVAWSILLVLVYFGLREWRLDRNTTDGEPLLGENIQAEVRVSRLIRFSLILVWLGGAFVIWSIAGPTLSFLKRVELLPEFQVVLDRPAEVQLTTAVLEQAPGGGVAEVEEQPTNRPASPRSPAVPAPASAQQEQPTEKRTALYLSDVLLALFIGILISMLMSNIPGLLQFSLFQWLKLDRGGEYAVTTICRYLVLMIGILVVSGTLGLDWSKVQWLAAALTVGIGFGLQEIFANFAAGLILLVDRSIRVGDVVTVGNLSGVVARIQTRATTVTLWDRSEMVVPNKEFITSKLVNWTRSNPETRVDLKVGVAYGSDVERVREVLMRVANAHPAALKQPPPQVLVTGFAESAINFELQVFGLYTYGRPVLLDELHRSVMKEFERENIVIAFPRLDVQLNAAGAAARVGSQ